MAAGRALLVLGGSDLGEARDRDLAMRGVTVGFWRSVGADA
jgi:hypothetical protein